MRPRPYPAYKDSGVEWLGDVPEHWLSKRFGFLFQFFSGGTPSTENSALWEGTLPWVSSKDMKTMVLSDTEDHISEEAVRNSATCKVPAGSLLIVARSGILKHSIPAAVITREMAINQDIRGCVPRPDVDAKFIAYLIEGHQQQLLPIWRQQGATVESLGFDSVKTTNLSLPPPAEQRAIAAYLDRETERVDALVAKKRALIERLKEKRTALISRTVTRGLPPTAARAAGLPENPPLKPTGLDWLGDIPAHWRLMALKWRSRCHSGDSIASAEAQPEPTLERSVPAVGGNGVMGYCGDSNTDHPVLVIGRVGALCGNVHLIEPPAWITDNALVMQIDTATFSLGYLSAVLRTRNLNELADKTAQPLITGTRVRNERIPVPPLPEQTAIVAYLDAETAKLDALVAKVETAIERLQEYRTALITAAVTGKIDVRGNEIRFSMQS